MTKEQAIDKAIKMGGAYIYLSPALREWTVVSCETAHSFTADDRMRLKLFFVTRDAKTGKALIL